MTYTTFKDIRIGGEFKAPGGRVIYTKITGHSARGPKKDILVAPTAKVVPEHDATVDDILNSWRSL